MNVKELRPYQTKAIQAMSCSIAQKKRPVGVVFPGGGKSLIIAEIIRRILAKNGNARVLMLVDTKELVQQNYIEFCDYVGLKAANLAGIYSAGLGKKESDKQVLFASIQSYVNAKKSAPFDFILIDECHLVPTDGSSQYRRVLDIETKKNPRVAVMGFTGTPFRMDMKGGTIVDSPKGIFNDLACNIGCRQLIDEGYLSPIISYEPSELHKKADLTGVEIRNGEFDEVQATKAFLRVLPAQVGEMLENGKNRKKWLIFCQSKEHSIAMARALNQHGVDTAVVFGDSRDRDQTISNYKMGKIKVLINVKVFSKGVNVEDIDKVVLCFATRSISDYVQKVGRGMRIAPGKKNTLVLDFGGNIARHGPIDQIKENDKKSDGTSAGVAPMKQCPKCGYIVALNQNICDICGHRFPKLFRDQGKDLTVNYQRGGILSDETEVVDVGFMSARNFITKKGDPCVIIDFYGSKQDRYPVHREFLNLWHQNQYAVKKSWESLSLIADTDMFKDVSESPGRLVDSLNGLILEGTIVTPKVIFLKQDADSRFKRLVGVRY